MQALMAPHFTTIDARINLQQWDRDAQRFTERFKEIIPDSLRMHVYLEKIAPQDFKLHALMDKARYDNPDTLRTGIEDYMGAKEESEQSADLAQGYIAVVQKHHLKKGDGKDKGKKGGGKERGNKR